MAKKYSAPGIFRKETDVSEVVSPTGTSTGVVVGGAVQGPANARTLIGTDKQLIDTFGKPQVGWANDFGIYAGLEFLQESNSLYFTRVTNGTEQYANLVSSAAGSASVTAQTITANASSAYASIDVNTADSIKDIDDVSNTAFTIAAVGPGVEGNKIAAKITTSAMYGGDTVNAAGAYGTAGISADCDWAYNYDDMETSGIPASASDALWKKVFKVEVFVKATSAAAAAVTSAADGSPDETFYGTLGDNLSPNGTQLNIQQVINGNSKYIYVNDGGLTGSPTHTSGRAKALTLGADGGEVGTSDVVNGWGFYTDREKVTCNILVGSYVLTAGTDYTVPNKIGSVAFGRLDCIGTVQIPSTPDVTDSDGYITKDTLNLGGPSYVAKYAGWDLIYDSFNDKKRYIPRSIMAGVLYARTDRIADTWSAPAGVNRGILPVLDSDFRFNETQIGNLYDNNINTAKFIKGVGNVMWGQRTAQRKASALREIAVRRLLLFLENTIEESLLNYMFEPNSAATRLRVTSVINAFMSSVAAGGGLEAYEVKCDDTNNLQQDIDNNIMNVDLYVQPTRTIEFIQLQVIITRSGVSFSEV